MNESITRILFFLIVGVILVWGLRKFGFSFKWNDCEIVEGKEKQNANLNAAMIGLELVILMFQPYLPSTGISILDIIIVVAMLVIVNLYFKKLAIKLGYLKKKDNTEKE